MNLKPMLGFAIVLFAISACKKDTLPFEKKAGQLPALKKINACTDAQVVFEGVKINSSTGGLLKATSLVTDKFGNIIIAGLYHGTIDFDPGPGVFNLSGQGVFIYKMDPNGKFIKAVSIPVTNIPPKNDAYLTKSFTDLDADAAGNVYLTLSEYVANDTDPRPIHIVKMDNSASISYNVIFNKQTTEPANSAVDSYGNIYTIGVTSRVFIQKRNANGNLVYSQDNAGIGQFSANIAIDYQNNLHLTAGYPIVIRTAYEYRKYSGDGTVSLQVSSWDPFGKPVTDTLGHLYMLRNGTLGQCSSAAELMWPTKSDSATSAVYKCTKGGDLYYVARAASYYTFNLVKYNVNGTLAWSKTVPTISTTNTGILMEPDNANNVIIVSNVGENQIRLVKYQVCQ